MQEQVEYRQETTLTQARGTTPANMLLGVNTRQGNMDYHEEVSARGEYAPVKLEHRHRGSSKKNRIP